MIKKITITYVKTHFPIKRLLNLEQMLEKGMHLIIAEIIQTIYKFKEKTLFLSNINGEIIKIC